MNETLGSVRIVLCVSVYFQTTYYHSRTLFPFVIFIRIVAVYWYLYVRIRLFSYVVAVLQYTKSTIVRFQPISLRVFSYYPIMCAIVEFFKSKCTVFSSTRCCCWFMCKTIFFKCCELNDRSVSNFSICTHTETNHFSQNTKKNNRQSNKFM